MSARRREADGGQRLDHTTVTIAVPTKNEAENIGRFLASIPAELPVVVVDSSDDDTPTLIRTLRPERTRVVRALADIPTARRLGAMEAETPWVLFTDADVAFAPDYFDRLSQLVVDETDGGLFGAKLSSGSYERYHRLFGMGQRVLWRVGVPAASGSNMLVSKTALDRVGGFDLDLTVNEDSELMFRVHRSGLRVRHVPSLAVTAFDHRRLARGQMRKLVHSVARCSLLWAGVMPRSWKRSAWGYWRPRAVSD